jgi:hypothetical protein
MEPERSLLCSQEPATGLSTLSQMNPVRILTPYCVKYILLFSSHQHFCLQKSLSVRISE